MKWFRRKKTPKYSMSLDMLELMRNSPPGKATNLITDDGSEYVVIHKDDFDHILSLAGMRSRSSKESP